MPIRVVDDLIPWTSKAGTPQYFIKGGKGEDFALPEPTDRTVVIVLGDGDDQYAFSPPSAEQMDRVMKGAYYGIAYHTLSPGGGHPSWAMYDNPNSIGTRGLHSDDDIGHGGVGNKFSLGPGADRIFVHGHAMDLGKNGATMLIVFNWREDKVFMDNSRHEVKWSQQAKLDPNDDGFRFHSFEYHRIDRDTIELDSFEATSYSRDTMVVKNQTAIFNMTDNSNHDPNWEPTRIDHDGDINHAIREFLDGLVGDSIL